MAGVLPGRGRGLQHRHDGGVPGRYLRQGSDLWGLVPWLHFAGLSPRVFSGSKDLGSRCALQRDHLARSVQGPLPKPHAGSDRGGHGDPVSAAVGTTAIHRVGGRAQGSRMEFHAAASDPDFGSARVHLHRHFRCTRHVVHRDPEGRPDARGDHRHWRGRGHACGRG